MVEIKPETIAGVKSRWAIDHDKEYAFYFKHNDELVYVLKQESAYSQFLKIAWLLCEDSHTRGRIPVKKTVRRQFWQYH